ncbi:MAG: hypothetical protein GY802_09545, partial [Gammaproteobacteria bacterium]|nr:hypothetical protein [Gammaproteobacteria bacterium]
MMRPLIVVALSILLQGCVSVATEVPSQDIDQVQVFYATDRKPQKTDSPGVYFGSKRGKKIHYGIAAVNVWPIDYQEENADGEIREIVSQPIDTGFSRADPLAGKAFFNRLRDPG